MLIPQKQSSKGTGIITADVNGDGLEDLFVGNAGGAAASLFLQSHDGQFKSPMKHCGIEAAYEDANALFFDADGDGDQDLYVVSAGYELPKTALYFKTGSTSTMEKAASAKRIMPCLLCLPARPLQPMIMMEMGT